MADPTQLYLIRHGETDYNLKSIIQGQLVDCSLNETGRSQAGILAKELSGVAFDNFYSSTLKRAQETAHIVASPHSVVQIQLVPELQEMSFGNLEGQPYGGQNQIVFERIAARVQNGIFTDRPGEGESVLDVQMRAVMGVEKIVRQNPGKTVAVVTHGRLLRILLATILDGFSLETMEELLHNNTAFSRLTVTGSLYEPLTLCSDDHLHDNGGVAEVAKNAGDGDSIPGEKGHSGILRNSTLSN